MAFETEVAILRHEMAAPVATLAVVRLGTADDYFNGLARCRGGVDRDPLVLMLGNTRADDEFLRDLTVNYDWGPLVDALCERGLKMIHIKGWKDS